MTVAGVPAAIASRITHVIAQMISDLDIQSPLEHRLGHQRQQPFTAIDRGARGLRVSQQRIDLGRVQQRRQTLTGVLGSRAFRLVHKCSCSGWSGQACTTTQATPLTRRMKHAQIGEVTINVPRDRAATPASRGRDRGA